MNTWPLEIKTKGVKRYVWCDECKVKLGYTRKEGQWWCSGCNTKARVVGAAMVRGGRLVIVEDEKPE